MNKGLDFGKTFGKNSPMEFLFSNLLSISPKDTTVANCWVDDFYDWNLTFKRGFQDNEMVLELLNSFRKDGRIRSSGTLRVGRLPLPNPCSRKPTLD